MLLDNEGPEIRAFILYGRPSGLFAFALLDEFLQLAIENRAG